MSAGEMVAGRAECLAQLCCLVMPLLQLEPRPASCSLLVAALLERGSLQRRMIATKAD